MPKKPTKRCAIYTRKSSEEGLELEYNSLHAQRDAGEAFIKSQKQEGWKVIKEAYDDGGISGGHMERPALQRMLSDLKAGKIDVIVVYKVDRLSRSLADFAQMMKVFDDHEVSFVSVTQQFNTSSSMGRLTLNVLLSFAQFEREVTGERIRDKMALSKKKGRWTGGVPPLGYDSGEGKLKVNTEEAEVVQQCFKLYLESSGLIETSKQLNNLGLRTKHYVSSRGRVYESKPWVAKQLHRVLTHPIYYGMVQFKGELYEGQHEAIVEDKLWEKVQRKLREHQPQKDVEQLSAGHIQHPLKGYVHTDDGFALTPTFTSKKLPQTTARKRYRYYVSQRAISQGYESSKIKTVNAIILETAVQSMISQALPQMGSEIHLEEFSREEVERRLRDSAQYFTSLGVHESGFIRLIHLLAPKIILGTDKIEICLEIENLKQLLIEGTKAENSKVKSLENFPNIQVKFKNKVITVSSEVNLKCTRGRTEIVDADTGKVVTARQSVPNEKLIQVIVQAEFWRQKVIDHPTKSLAEIIKSYKVSYNYVLRILNAAYLAPEIKKAIFQGTQPLELQVQDLTQKHSADWRIQKRELQFI